MPAASEDDPVAKQAEARQYFERGLALHEKGAWDAALGEFVHSRKVLPTRAATKYAASCLKSLQRFDEALEMFEEVLAFPNLSDKDKAFAQLGVNDAAAHVGVIEVTGGEPGMSVVVDGRFRGTLPFPTPLRVTAGSHEIGAFKEGRDPFGASVQAIAQKIVAAELRSQATGGRLKIAEQRQRSLNVIVDGVVVGKTPWEGALSVGDHYVALRGNVSNAECTTDPKEQKAITPETSVQVEVGTQPVPVPIKLHELSTLTLLAEELDTVLRVEPMPGGASIAVDSVLVGHGAWEGRLRVGEHKVEVMDDGFLPDVRRVQLAREKRTVIRVELDRDPNTPEWRAMRNRWVFGAFGVGAAGLGVFAVSGGLAVSKANDVRSACVGGVCPPSVVGNLNSSHTLGIVATAGLVTGLAGLGAGAAIFFAMHPKAQEKQHQDSAVTVTAGVGLGGLTVAGSF